MELKSSHHVQKIVFLNHSCLCYHQMLQIHVSKGVSFPGSQDKWVNQFMQITWIQFSQLWQVERQIFVCLFFLSSFGLMVDPYCVLVDISQINISINLVPFPAFYSYHYYYSSFTTIFLNHHLCWLNVRVKCLLLQTK